MGQRMIFLLFIALVVTQGVLGEVWEFGLDAPGSIIVDHKEGNFTLFQKNKEIKLRLPQCYVMEYVRVQVQNTISNPTVKYNKHTNSVSISYKPLQISVSSYNIVAKAARKPGCYHQTAELHTRNLFGK